MTINQIRQLIDEVYGDFQVNKDLVLAIALIESGGNPYRMIYRPRFLGTVNDKPRPNHCPNSTEIRLQKYSFGLMQLMGGTMRRIGFVGWLSELLDPQINIIWGCNYLDLLSKKYTKGIATIEDDLIAAYNCGSPRRNEETGEYINQRYVNRIWSAISEIEKRGS